MRKLWFHAESHTDHITNFEAGSRNSSLYEALIRFFAALGDFLHGVLAFRSLAAMVSSSSCDAPVALALTQNAASAIGTGAFSGVS
jgi:hypothetical protein